MHVEVSTESLNSSWFQNSLCWKKKKKKKKILNLAAQILLQDAHKLCFQLCLLKHSLHNSSLTCEVFQRLRLDDRLYRLLLYSQHLSSPQLLLLPYNRCCLLSWYMVLLHHQHLWSLWHLLSWLLLYGHHLLDALDWSWPVHLIYCRGVRVTGWRVSWCGIVWRRFAEFLWTQEHIDGTADALQPDLDVFLPVRLDTVHYTYLNIW